MGQLIFYDDAHKYQLDGVELPSVSKVTRFISREVYGDVNQYVLDNACARGTKVHKATELLDKYGKVECDEETVPYVQAYIKWRKDFGIDSDKISEIESAYGNAELGYAGTIDRVFYVDGEYWLVDIKTSSTPQKRIWDACLNGYKMLWEKENPDKKISKMFDLHLKKDGTYKPLDVPDDPEPFLACLTLEKLMQKKRKTKKGD